jgi:hypothetical protein
LLIKQKVKLKEASLVPKMKFKGAK